MTRKEAAEYLHDIKRTILALTVGTDEDGEYMKQITSLTRSIDEEILERHEEFVSREELERVWNELLDDLADEAGGGRNEG